MPCTRFYAQAKPLQPFRVAGREYKIVIVPTAPVPFGGGLIFVPVESVLPSDMSVDGLMSIYVSMGVTAPKFMKQNLVDAQK